MPKNISMSRGRPRRPKGTREITNTGGTPATSSVIPRSNYLSTNVAGVTQSLRRTLVGGFSGQITVNASSYNETTFGLNNAYSVYASVAATGYAKYMALYSKCFVLGSRQKVKLLTNSTSATLDLQNPMIMGYTITTNSTTLGLVATAIGAGLCDYDVGQYNPDRHVVGGRVSVSQFLDKPQVLDDPQLFSTASAGPGQVIIGHLWFYNFGTVNNTIVTFATDVELDVVFTDPIPFT